MKLENNLKSTLSQHFKDLEGCTEYDLSGKTSSYSDDLIKFFELLIEADIKTKQKKNNKYKGSMV